MQICCRQRVFVLGSFVLLSSYVLKADEWRSPEPHTYCSANGLYCVLIVPANYEPNYSPPTAMLSGGLVTNVPTIFSLVNRVSPTNALVSNDGRFVITFDNWGGIGYGNDVVVIYRADGTVVKCFSLNDFVSDDYISGMPHTLSSIKWSGRHFLDDAAGTVVLQIFDPRCSSKNDNDHFISVSIDLQTGKKINPNQAFEDLWFVEQIEPPQIDIAKTTLCQEHETQLFIELTSSVVQNDLIFHLLPEYPQYAKRARVYGTVILIVRIGPDGVVKCLGSLKGLPMGITEASITAVKQWRFASISSESDQIDRLLIVAFSFRRRVCPD